MFSRIFFAVALVALAAPVQAQPPQQVAALNVVTNQKSQKQRPLVARNSKKCVHKHCPKKYRAAPSHP
jgi:hypothetical protein